MKSLLKIMSVFVLTSIATINVVACDIWQNSPIDYNQLLEDAAKLIANNEDPNFAIFLKDKNKTYISDFIKLIEENIGKLFATAKEDFSNLTYTITNGSDQVNDSNTIKIKLAVYVNPIVKDCSFTANFTALQDYIDKRLKPLVNGTKYLSISKNDIGGFYQQLVTVGADFKGEKEHYFKNSSGKANDFWKNFQEWDPRKEKNPLLGNVLAPLLDYIGNSPRTGLTFNNFKPYLLSINGENNIIAITGNSKFGDKNYDYIKIGLVGKDSDTAALGNKYNNLTFIFT
ncbi:hypothetical protein [Spiroplasma endosymbiont of Polydrusus pterygomalis]|uniref:hypothetical protein n=1 Tax=Spiroplasma endosymbiont of Polydrusus pterygomalis TaxID=3139327 RepID=UPI003CCAD312